MFRSAISTRKAPWGRGRCRSWWGWGDQLETTQPSALELWSWVQGRAVLAAKGFQRSGQVWETLRRGPDETWLAGHASCVGASSRSPTSPSWPLRHSEVQLEIQGQLLCLRLQCGGAGGREGAERGSREVRSCVLSIFRDRLLFKRWCCVRPRAGTAGGLRRKPSPPWGVSASVPSACSHQRPPPPRLCLQSLRLRVHAHLLALIHSFPSPVWLGRRPFTRVLSATFVFSPSTNSVFRLGE